MILTGNDCDHFDQILNSLHFPRFPLWLLTFHLLLSFFLIRVFGSLPFLAFFLVLIDDRRLLSIKTKLGLNRCLSQGTKAVSQLLDAKILHFGIISGHSGHGNFRSKSFRGCHVPSEFAGFNKNNKSEKSMSRSECSWTLSLKWMVSCKKEATMCCCFPLILFFPFENLIVYFASEYSLYHIIFSLFCCKDTENIWKWAR